LYIDSNIFIFAALDNTELGDNCRKILDMIQNKKITCASSYLTIDEIVRVLKKKIGKEKAVRIVKATLSMPIKWIDVDRTIILRMLEDYKDNNLDPRDSLHLSSLRSAGITTILSEDSDFDNITGIERMDTGTLLHDEILL
jgi:uncharacterized protein